MAAKKKSMGPTSQGTSAAKKALAGMEQGHKILQLNLKKLETIVAGHFHAGKGAGHFGGRSGGHFGGGTGGHFGGITGGHFDGRARASRKAR